MTRAQATIREELESSRDQEDPSPINTDGLSGNDPGEMPDSDTEGDWCSEGPSSEDTNTFPKEDPPQEPGEQFPFDDSVFSPTSKTTQYQTRAQKRNQRRAEGVQTLHREELISRQKDNPEIQKWKSTTTLSNQECCVGGGVPEEDQAKAVIRLCYRDSTNQPGTWRTNGGTPG